MRRTTILAILQASFCTTAYPKRPLDIEITREMRERCHIIRFSQGWTVPLTAEGTVQFYTYSKDYEFRIEGELGSRFLVAGVVRSGYPGHAATYTSNKYLLDLSDRKARVLAATEKMWNDGLTVAQTTKGVLQLGVPDSKVFQINGHTLTKSGQHWTEDRLSPDRRWIVLQSWQGRSGSLSESWGPPLEWSMLLGYKGKAFWDIFNADTGRRVLTIRGRYNTSNAMGDMLRSFWLTERYFIIPLDEHREQCLVCEFGGKAETKKK